jgi:hypothetical protein
MPQHDAQHGRDRAAEARAMAAGFTDPRTRQIMQDIAKGYDRMAAQVEAHAKGQPEDST